MIVVIKARSNLRQPILTILALLIPAAIFIAAAPTNSPNINSLKPAPPIPVAFVISEGAVVIDFCGPWEVFRDVMVGNDHPFRLYTVSDKTAPIQAGGGMKIVPDYTFANAPAPKIIVIPAQSEPSTAMLEWICPVCGMDVDPKTAPKSVFQGKTYYFCSDDDKKTFDAAPEKLLAADKKS